MYQNWRLLTIIKQNLVTKIRGTEFLEEILYNQIQYIKNLIKHLQSFGTVHMQGESEKTKTKEQMIEPLHSRIFMAEMPYYRTALHMPRNREIFKHTHTTIF